MRPHPIMIHLKRELNLIVGVSPKGLSGLPDSCTNILTQFMFELHLQSEEPGELMANMAETINQEQLTVISINNESFQLFMKQNCEHLLL